jgi:hypothetical protein
LIVSAEEFPMQDEMAKPRVPFAKGRKVCIFCGRTPVTKEHLWPEWVHPLLPPNKTHFRKLWDVNKNSGSAVLARDYDRQGSPATIRIERVCGTCNSGWMGDYEEAVRPLLEPMVGGESVILDEQQQRLLAEYFTYKMLVADWEANPIVNDSARRSFYENRVIPPHTQIYFFKCGEPPWRLNIIGHAVGLWPDDKPMPAPGSYNTKSFAMGFGDLFIMTVLAPDVDGYPRLTFQPGMSIQVYPLFNDPIHWPPLLAINAQGADDCANALWNIDEFPDFKSGGRG